MLCKAQLNKMNTNKHHKPFLCQIEAGGEADIPCRRPKI